MKNLIIKLKKTKPIFWLSIWEEFFKVVFFFSTDTRDKILDLPISSETRETVKNTEAMGKTMKFIPVAFEVYDEEQLEDLYIMSQFKKENT